MDNKLILKKMKEKGFNTLSLSEKTGISVSTINKIVYGVTTNPTIDNLQAIANALNCRVDDFIDREEPTQGYYLDPEAAEAAQEMFERKELRVLYDASRNVSKEDILQVADILAKLKKEQGIED